MCQEITPYEPHIILMPFSETSHQRERSTAYSSRRTNPSIQSFSQCGFFLVLSRLLSLSHVSFRIAQVAPEGAATFSSTFRSFISRFIVTSVEHSFILLLQVGLISSKFEYLGCESCWTQIVTFAHDLATSRAVLITEAFDACPCPHLWPSVAPPSKTRPI